MKRLLMVAVVSLVLVGAARAQEPVASTHVLVSGKDIQWGPALPIFEKGASMAVISGDPSKPGLYVVRLKLPAGYKINPHWHPTDEHVTVLLGTLALGMGDKLEKKALKDLPPGGYALLPANMHHFAMAKTAATIQVHGMGPFALTYVDPADDPSTRNAAK